MNARTFYWLAAAVLVAAAIVDLTRPTEADETDVWVSGDQTVGLSPSDLFRFTVNPESSLLPFGGFMP